MPHFIFRYFSGRGTDQRICVKLADGTTDKQALEIAKDWAEQCTAGTACHEYTVTVRRVKVSLRKQWLKQWEQACERKRLADDRYNDLRAMSAVKNWSDL